MAIWLQRVELITTTSEIIGYKSGLALTQDRLIQLTPTDYSDVWDGPDGCKSSGKMGQFWDNS